MGLNWVDTFLYESFRYLENLKRGSTSLQKIFWQSIQDEERQGEITFAKISAAKDIISRSNDHNARIAVCIMMYRLLTHNNPGVMFSFYLPRKQVRASSRVGAVNEYIQTFSSCHS